MTARLRVMTANLLKGRDPKVVVRELQEVREEFAPDVIGCQEAGGYAGSLDKAFPAIMPAGAVGQNNPILYNDLTLSERALGVHVAHAGKAGYYPPRGVVWGEFEVLADGSVLFANNTHINHHIDDAGQQIKLPRLPLAISHLAYFADKMKGDAAGDHVALGTGDFNIDEDADNGIMSPGFPAATFGAKGIISVYDALNTPATWDTHGRRKIDEVYFYRGDTRLSVVPGSLQKVKKGSDHWWVMVDFDLRPLQRWWGPAAAIIDRTLYDSGRLAPVSPEARDAAEALAAADWLKVPGK